MWILLAMIAIMPFEINPYLKISKSFLGVFPDFTMIKLLGLIGLGWVVLELVGGRERLRLFEERQTRAFFVFLSIVTFASIASGAGLTSLTRLLSIVFFLPLTLTAVRTEGNLRLALKASALIMILTFPYAYRQVIRFGGRLGVGFYEPNYLALALLLLLPLPFVFARQESTGWKRKLWMAGMGVLLLELVLTGSRGAFLGLLVILLLLAFRLMKRPMLALGGMACLLLMIFAFPTNLGHRLLASSIDTDIQDTGIRVSNETRFRVLDAGLRMIQANPLTGVGLGNFKPSALAYGAEVDKIAHNTYLELAAELGLPALAAFLWLLHVTFASLRRAGRLAVSAGRHDLAELATVIRTGLAGYLVSAAFLSAEFEKFFWVVVFLSICLERIVAGLSKEAEAEPALNQIRERRLAWRVW